VKYLGNYARICPEGIAASKKSGSIPASSGLSNITGELVELLVFRPFYERFAAQLGHGNSGKISLSFLAGALFFVPHIVAKRGEVLNDFSWLLAILISSALLFLYYATSTLNELIPYWKKQLEHEDEIVFMGPLCRTLSDGRFVSAGLFFGFLNMVIGYAFGIPASNQEYLISIFFGYFLAGFCCGLPAYGIYGVVVTIKAFTREGRLDMDYTAPDRCAGMSFMGTALVKFSVVTLLEGILLATYIFWADWDNAGNAWVTLLMWGWIVFPFVLSLLVLLIPATDINQMLIRYRREKEQELKKLCSQLRAQIEDKSLENVRANLRNEYEYHCQRRQEVYNMRTWPFSTNAVTSFVSVFISNVLLATELAKKLF